MRALPLILTTLCLFAIAYRYYSAFIAAKVLALDPKRETPAHTKNDGQNYHPTNKWVLFGHHFAAITGAGPLIGPVLATQFGFLPGFLWLVIGVVLAGAVHDLIIMAASVRHGGQSLAQIARAQMGPVSGLVCSIAILLIIVIALAGLGIIVVNNLMESIWGTFTIACTIPLALFMGLYLYRFRKGKVFEVSLIGVAGLILAVIVGKWVVSTDWGSKFFLLNAKQITISIAVYGFIASILPVWMLLCPRDYLSSYMKIGVIALLALAILWVNPTLKMPAVTEFVHGGGPLFSGKVFPFVFTTIACGAISGFHGLVASGTTPKMIASESHIRPIAYGSMLFESFVGLMALIAASSLEPADYFAINAKPEVFAAMNLSPVHLATISKEVGEQLQGRTGGGTSLAVGVAEILSSVSSKIGWKDYWYHFIIMFEALFILTTIDTGTRIGRFLLQEFGGLFSKKLGQPDWLPGTLLSSALIVGAWSYFILTGSISTIWPMFGIANQLLAAVGLCVMTVWFLNTGRKRFIWVTLIPLLFVAITTLSAAWESIAIKFYPMTQSSKPKDVFQGWINISLIAIIASLALVLFLDTILKGIRSNRIGKQL